MNRSFGVLWLVTAWLAACGMSGLACSSDDASSSGATGEPAADAATGDEDGAAPDVPDVAEDDPLDTDEGDDTSSKPDTAGCTTDDECDTGDPCFVSVCGAGGECAHTPLEGKACDDDDACTEGDACDAAGACLGTPVVVEDVVCADCSCDPERGVVCIPKGPGAACNDGDCCTTSDACTPCEPGEDGCSRDGLSCVGQPEACDDGESCTVDVCTCEDGDADCAHEPAPNGAECVADPNLCTEGDACADGICVTGEPAELSDGNPCTQDLCIKGVIEHQPLAEGQCDDGDECTVGDSCVLGTCVGAGAVECALPECAGSVECITGQGCTPSYLPVGAVCSGGPCGQTFTCNEAHECVPETGLDCDDNDACTVDSCDEAASTCIHTLAVNCDDAGECLLAECNPVSGLCDIPAADGTPCSTGECSAGECVCVPVCGDAVCGDDGCGGTCGGCPPEEVCDDGACVGGCAGCPDSCLPDGSCCPPDGFCPTSDTELSGTQSFSVMYIPPAVTVTCVGDAPLVLNVSGSVWVDGALRANGIDGSSSSSASSPGACGGFEGGDGFRNCTSSATTFCENNNSCDALLSPKESPAGPSCAYLGTAPGQPGFGPGGGWGGQMTHPLHNAAPGSAAGGGGGSYATVGTAGIPGSNICSGNPSPGGPGVIQVPDEASPAGGSGGGAGGMARAGECGLACPLGCTAWGGDGGAGGGVIELNATGAVSVAGQITVMGGDGGTAGGAVCGGSGGGGAGGAIVISAADVITEGSQSSHLLVNGGAGGEPKCVAFGEGGDGGAGVVFINTD